MTIQISDDKGPELAFCCDGARVAWDADALVIVPEPHGEDDPLVYTAALNYEGGAALRIAFCPFCAKPVQPSIAQ